MCLQLHNPHVPVVGVIWQRNFVGLAHVPL
jgi:hypothetical protein